jgi:hypothetical protein
MFCYSFFLNVPKYLLNAFPKPDYYIKVRHYFFFHSTSALPLYVLMPYIIN